MLVDVVVVVAFVVRRYCYCCCYAAADAAPTTAAAASISRRQLVRRRLQERPVVSSLFACSFVFRRHSQGDCDDSQIVPSKLCFSRLCFPVVVQEGHGACFHSQRFSS